MQKYPKTDCFCRDGPVMGVVAMDLTLPQICYNLITAYPECNSDEFVLVRLQDMKEMSAQLRKRNNIETILFGISGA